MQARDIAQTTFVLVRAEERVELARQLIEQLDPTHAIIQRDDRVRCYYLFSKQEALRLLVGTRGAATIQEAVTFRESDATRVVEAWASVNKSSPDQFVVLADGQVHGFVDALVPPTIGAPRRGAPEVTFGGYAERTYGGDEFGTSVGGGRGALAGRPTRSARSRPPTSGAPRRGVRDRTRAADTRAADAPEPSRSLVAEFPERVALGEVKSLLVALSALAPLAGGIPIGDLPAGTTIDVLVQARRGFVLEGNEQGVLTVTDQEEGLPLQFELRSTALGPGQIRVLAFRCGVALGAIRLTPTVVERTVTARGVPATPVVGLLAPATVQLPDLSLFVEEAWVDGQRGFRLLITSADATLNLAKYGPIIFQQDPGIYFRDFYQDIEGFGAETGEALTGAGERNLTPPGHAQVPAPRTDEDRAAAAQRLANKGILLFDTLIPPEARKLLWSLRGEIKTVLLQSDEPWIPWELCKLYGEEDGEVVEGPFFCEAFAITRWMPGIGLKPSLTLGNLAVVVPCDSQLPCAAEEQEYLLSLQGNGRQVTQIPARFLAVQGALKSGRFDGWHFSGHGASRAADPNRSVMQLERGDRMTPETIVGSVTNLGKARPLVFLNACQIGRSGMSLTDIGGWAERFLRAGAGAFVGAYWSVFDQSAYDFARELYDRLLAGVPIGRAAQEARLAIRAAGDPTWLAYTVFGHPLAIVR